LGLQGPSPTASPAPTSPAPPPARATKPFHLALAAILAGRSSLRKELSALRRIGHSSGMDALGGALLTLEVTDALGCMRAA